MLFEKGTKINSYEQEIKMEKNKNEKSVELMNNTIKLLENKLNKIKGCNNTEI